MKKLPKLLALIMMLFITSGSYLESKASVEPDYSGAWDFTFYDAAGKIQGGKTIIVAEDGSFSTKANMNIENTIYATEISASISAAGKIKDGTLTNADKLEIQGTMSGTFTETEGSGTWKNYYGKGGTWKATRSEKKDKR